ncbi:MAG: AAA family ATPase [Hyphomonadaceae bacterium]|nr:AAA family ATPase [Hyphomonadaceae bacterium]
MNVVSIRRGEEDFFEPERPPEEDQGAALRNLYAIFLRRWRLIAAAAIVVFAAVMTYTLLSPKVYTATALIMVNPGREQVIAQEQMIENSAPSSAAVDSEIEVLRSMLLSTRLAEAENLIEDPEWNSALRPPGPLSMALAPIQALFAQANEPDAADREESQRDQVARAVNKAISVRRRGLSYGIEISLDAGSPRRAAELLNRFTQLYLSAQTEARFEASQRANSWLSGRLEELRREVQTKERAAEQYRLANGLSVAAGGAESQAPQSEEVQTMLVQSRADLAEKEARLRQLRTLLQGGGSADSLAPALSSQTITELRTREADLAQRVAELRRRYSAEHPTVLAAETELDNVRQRIQDEIRRIAANLQNEVDVARARLGTLQGSFGGVAGAAETDNEAVIHYRELLRDAAAARSVHESFLQRYHEVADQGELPIATSRVVSPALAPSAPSKPNMTSSLLMAVLLAGLTGAGLAFLIETLDASIGNAEDAERKVGAPTLASVPMLKPHDYRASAPHRRNPADYLVDKPASAFAEALRVLRTAIGHVRLDHKPKVIAITSALPNEGKTTTALCLARIAAMSGQRVVIVDCDLRRRSLSALLAPHSQAGLLQVLSGERAWSEALIQDSDSDVHVLPAPGARFTPQDVFASQAMARLIEDLRAAYDVVLLDCAPVLAIAETRTIAERADATLFVVRADKTPAAAVKTAVREVRASGATIAGLTLNYVDPRRPGRGGAYGDSLYYSYARGYYHQ